MSDMEQRKPYFPLFVDLSDSSILVVGGGVVALRKTKTLMRFCGHVTVVAPEIRPEFEALAAAHASLRLVRRTYQTSDLDGVRIAILATDDSVLNAEIAAACAARGILKNVASDRTLCDFYFPAVVERDGAVIGIGSSGNPALSRRIREILEAAADAEHI